MYLIKRREIFYICFKDETGKEKRISTGEKKKSGALRALTELELHKPEANTKNNLILSAFRDEYIKYAELSFRPSYVKRAIRPAFKKIIEYAGDISIQDLHYRQAEKFILESFNSSKYTAALYYRTLKSSFSKAINWGYIKENPFTRVKLPKIPVSLPAYITEADLKIIIQKTEKKVLRNLFFTTFHTGMRLGEIVNLQWNSIDLVNKIITIKNNSQFTTKNKKERIIPINNSLYGLLSKNLPKGKCPTDKDFVFCSKRGVKLDDQTISKEFKKAARAAGMDERIHFHSLRHSFASNLVQKGTSLFIIGKLLGHTDLKTTQVYAHLEQKNLFDAVKKLDQDIPP